MNTFNSKKIHLKAILCLTIAILYTANLQATTYYISNNGNNSANGTTTTTAWQTIAKLNSQTFLPGDTVLFHAGHIWRETWTIDNSGSKGNNIYFGRYGEGDNPKIVGSDKAENWTATGTTNVWQTGTSLTNYSEDYYAGRLFIMLDDSIAYGDFKEYDAGFTNLTEEFDYTVNGTTHYIYSTVDPDEAYNSIEVNQRERVVNLDYFQSYLEFNGIDLLFGRRSNFFAGYPAPAGKGATDLIFRNCYIGYTGAKGSGSAYGIACYHSNLLIENCTFSDNGRRAISVNTYASEGNPGRRLENVIIRNNTFKRGYHTTSLDLSSMGVEGDTVEGVYFYNNYIDDSEIKEIGDWDGSNQIFFQSGDSSSYMTNIYIVGNVFVQATWRNILLEGNRAYYIWHNTVIGHNPIITNNPWGNIGCGGADTIDFRNNILYGNLPDNDLENNLLHGYQSDTYFPFRDYNLYWELHPKTDRNFTSVYSEGGNYYYQINQWSNYLSKFTSYDQNSPTPQDPYFTNYNNFDFTLTDSSSAKYAGTVLPYIIITDPFGVVDTINKYDITGHIRNQTTPSIGAYEFKPNDNTAIPKINTESEFLEIYPNPAIDFFNITIKGLSANNYTVQLYDLQGKVLYRRYNLSGNRHVIPTVNVPSGLYIVELTFNNTEVLSHKLLIKK